MSNPFQLLGLEPTCSLAQLKESYRRLALERHPDRGGSAEEFNELHRAYASCRKAVANRKCQACDGAGKITTTKGFYSLTKRCLDCGGTGKENP